jgi:uncharacterized protein (TIGR02145 family)
MGKIGKLGWMVCGLSSMAMLMSQAQSVSKVAAIQEGPYITVKYHLETKEPCSVQLYCSEDGGKKWEAVEAGLSGEKSKLISGDHALQWEVLSDREELVSDQVVFKVKATQQPGGFKSVTIGEQVWMAENLNVDRYRNGDLITEVKEDNQWYVMREGAWCYYNNEYANGEIYGRLYNWYAVNDSRGLCPVGWHVPSDEEWTTLEDYLEGSELAGGYMKAMRLWNSPNAEANNESEFGALPGGYRNGWGVNGDLGKDGFWWSSDALNNADAWDRNLSHKDGAMGRSANNKSLGFSVRCLMD